jgi:hypothetical protein
MLANELQFDLKYGKTSYHAPEDIELTLLILEVEGIAVFDNRMKLWVCAFQFSGILTGIERNLNFLTNTITNGLFASIRVGILFVMLDETYTRSGFSRLN